jgi:GH43 family beta-xylosidase
MKTPYTLSGPRVKISSPTEVWETGGPLNLNEGPEVLKNRNQVFIIYSCRESWLKEYRLGQLRLKSANANPLDPSCWIKTGPVFQGTEEVLGTGHCSFVLSPNDSENWIIYHSKKDKTPGWKRDVRAQKFTWNKDGSPYFGIPVPAGLEIKRPAGEYKLQRAEGREHEAKRKTKR